ncbi:MAG: class I SAM-dependent methyltransferase [Pyrinomonadaceae bacterium]
MLDNKWEASLYDKKHSFVFKYGEDLVTLLRAQSGERVLDIGCGTGHLTKLIADTGAKVVGIDNTPDMIEAAREHYPQLDFTLANASNFSFDLPFDAVFSNAALHWIGEPDKTAACMARALRDGGRLVVEFGGRGNVTCIIKAAQDALREIALVDVEYGLYFPSIGEYAAVLERHGLAVQNAALFNRWTKLDDADDGLRNWLKMFGGSLFNNVTDRLREKIITATEDKLRDKLFRDGSWHADYRRLRVIAYKREY